MPDDPTEPDDAGELFTDAELAHLALSADPDQVVPEDAVPFVPDDVPSGLLPEWYMPTPNARASTSRTVVLAGVAIALFMVNVGGVCVTYGIPDPVWR